MSPGNSAFDDVVSRFESAWRAGSIPTLQAFLPSVDCAAELLHELVMIDQEFRWRQSHGGSAAAPEKLLLEDYAARIPQVVHYGPWPLDVIVNEYYVRHRFGDRPGHAAMQQRFPYVAAALLPLLQKTDQELRHRPQRSAADSMIHQDTFDVPPVMELTASGLMIGPYKLISKLGEGGMGAVWMAEQTEPLERKVALKLIKTGLSSKEVIARFEAERQVLAMMDHPHIARVLDAGTTTLGQPYFVMELVQGVPFNRYCDENNLSIEERLRLFIPVCQAVQHAHRRGIIHRDLKPSNVLVGLCDGTPGAKVIDFGLAKALQPNTRLSDRMISTAFGQLVGTLQYMSPEQAELGPTDIDTRTDVYSLGVMLYEILTGTTPISADELHFQAILQVLEAIRCHDPLKPSMRLSNGSQEEISGVSALRQIEPEKLQRILRGELDWIVMRAIEKDRSRRYDSANALAEDLDRYLTGQTVLARPASLTYRLSKFIRRHRAAVIWLTSFLVLLSGGLLLSIHLLAEARQARTAATQRETELAQVRQKEEEQRVAAGRALSLANSEAKKRRQAQETAQTAIVNNEASKARSLYLAALRARQENQPGKTRHLLQQIPPKFRNFEWFYMDGEACGNPVGFHEHQGMVLCLSFSPDGKHVVSGGDDQTLRIWESDSGQEVRILRGHSDDVTHVVFSPDGTRVVSGSDDGTVRIWDAASGSELLRLHIPTDSLECFAISPDGTKIAAGNENSILLWDSQSGRELRSFEEHSGKVTSIAFSPNGLKLASGSEDETIRIRNVETGGEVQTLVGQESAVNSLAYGGDGNRLASTGSYSSLIILWDVTSGRQLRSLKESDYWVSAMDFSPDGTRIVFGDSRIKVWDLTAAEESVSPAGPEADSILCLAFSSDGARVACGTNRQGVMLTDLRSGKRGDAFLGHAGAVQSVAISRDGAKIVSGGDDGTVKLWDTASGVQLGSFKGHQEPVKSLSCSPDGSRIVSASGSERTDVIPWIFRRFASPQGTDGVSSNDGESTAVAEKQTVKLWDTASGRELPLLEVNDGSVISVAFSPDGTRFVTGSADSVIRLWDAITGKVLRTFRGHHDAVASVCFSADGLTIASGSADGLVRIWNVTTGEELRNIGEEQDWNLGVTCVNFSLDGSRLVVGTGDGTVTVCQTHSGEEIWSIEANDGRFGGVGSVAFNPDGTRVLTACGNGSIRLWDANTGEEVFSLPGHKEGAACAVFSADGRLLVSSGWDSAIRCWRWAEPAATRQFRAYGAILWNVALSADGTRILSVGGDRQNSQVVKLWDAATSQQLWEIKCDDLNLATVGFSANSAGVVVEDFDGNRTLWDLRSGEPLQGSETPHFGVWQVRSPDGRWLVTPGERDIVVVDLEYYRSPAGQNRQRRAAGLRLDWHREQAAAAEFRKDWYAAVFHRAWVLKGAPESISDRESLQKCHAILIEEHADPPQRLTALIPPELRK